MGYYGIRLHMRQLCCQFPRRGKLNADQKAAFNEVVYLIHLYGVMP